MMVMGWPRSARRTSSALHSRIRFGSKCAGTSVPSLQANSYFEKCAVRSPIVLLRCEPVVEHRHPLADLAHAGCKFVVFTFQVFHGVVELHDPHALRRDVGAEPSDLRGQRGLEVDRKSTRLNS